MSATKSRVAIHTHTSGDKININGPDNSDISVKIARQTWATRYAAIMHPEGYNTGKRLVKVTPIKQWIEQTKPPVWFVDAEFFYYSLIDSRLYVDFTRLHGHSFVQPPINYFAAYSPSNMKVYKLFSLLQAEGFHLVTKERGNKIDPDNVRDLAIEQVIKMAEQRSAFGSMAAEIIVRMLDLAWNADAPEMRHALVLSQDNQLLPAVNYLHRMAIPTTLAIAPNRTVSNFYLHQFDHIINLHDLLGECEALTKRLVRE